MHFRSLKEKSPQLSLLSLLSYQISIIKKSKLYCSTDCFPQKFRMKRRCQIFSIATRSLVRNLFSLGRGVDISNNWTFSLFYFGKIMSDLETSLLTSASQQFSVVYANFHVTLTENMQKCCLYNGCLKSKIKLGKGV